MSGTGKTFKMPTTAILAITAFAAVACGSTSREKSWDQKFNDEVASMDINLGTPHESPAFEFSMNQHPPHFSMILCKGDSDDSRMQKDAWNVFFNEARKYGPAESYKPEFTDAGEVDGKSFTQIMMFVNLKEGADSSVAQDVARKMVNVMKQTSSCR